ncbi:transcription factor subunit Med10 of mediator complex-domain-containing protein [Xylariaceae sp. FL1019]|nr:transcription factor subunit Med10 of mediator complex-domain-containing protein [Xylariaceae sp. FL1019]
MAPMAPIDHNAIEQQLKDTIQSLHSIMVQVTSYDASGQPPPTPSHTSRASRDVIAAELVALSRSLQAVHHISTTRALPQVPPELVQYVDNGRNPDIYTREFVELVRRGNQLMRGKQSAFASFKDVLAAQIQNAMPELKDDTVRVLEATAGGSTAASSGGATQ